MSFDFPEQPHDGLGSGGDMSDFTGHLPDPLVPPDALPGYGEGVSQSDAPFLPTASSGGFAGEYGGAPDDRGDIPVPDADQPTAEHRDHQVSHEAAVTDEASVDARLGEVVSSTVAQLDTLRSNSVTRRAIAAVLRQRVEQLGSLLDETSPDFQEVKRELGALQQQAEDDETAMGDLLATGRVHIWNMASEQAAVADGVVNGEEYLRAALQLSPPFDNYESHAEREARVAALMEMSAQIVPDQPAVVRLVDGRGYVSYSAAAAHDHPGGLSFAPFPHDPLSSMFVVGVGDHPVALMNSAAFASMGHEDPETGHADVDVQPNITVGVGQEASAALLTADCNGFTDAIHDLSQAMTDAGEQGNQEAYGRLDRERFFVASNLVDTLEISDRAGVALDFGERGAAMSDMLVNHFVRIGGGQVFEQPVERMERVGRAVRQLNPGITNESLREYLVQAVSEQLGIQGEEQPRIFAAHSIARLTGGNYTEIYARFTNQEEG